MVKNTRPSVASDRRETSRIEVSASVSLAGSKLVAKGQISNLSLGGALVTTTDAVQLHEGDAVSFDLAVGGPGSEVATRIPGRIKRILPTSVGVAFDVSAMRVDSLVLLRLVLVVNAANKKEAHWIGHEFDLLLEREESRWWGNVVSD